MRLRDGASTLGDCNLWKSHDILDPQNSAPDLLRSAGNYLWIGAENAGDGRRNGDKVGNLAETRGCPIIRYESMQNNISAGEIKHGEFMGLRAVTHIAHEAPVMRARNKI